MRRLLPLLVVAAVATLLAVAFWPKRDPRRPAPAELEPHAFSNALPDLHPPLAALQPAVLADPVVRCASRIEWVPPDVLYWTLRHLPDDRARLAALLIERYERVIVGSPLLAQRFVDALGEVADPSALPFLRRLAELAPPEHEHLQLSAIRALAKFPRDDATEAVMLKLSADPRRAIATTAMREIVRSEELGTVEAMNGFLAANDEGDALPFLQQVGLRQLAGCADACVRHLAAKALLVRQNAIFALLAVGDARGFAAAREELDSGEEQRVLLAVTVFRDAAAPLPLDVARRLVDHPTGDMRRELALALGLGRRGEASEAVDALLVRLAADRDPIVARAACEQLYRRGRDEAVAPWRDRVAHGYGSALREAIVFLCELVRDPATAPLLRARLDGETLANGSDEGNLLGGLREYHDASDAPRFIRRILAAGSDADRRAGERSWLSDLAATHVQALGPGAGVALAEALQGAPTAKAELALIDALRGVLKGMAPEEQARCAEQLFARIVDASRPAALRREAIDTIVFFDDARLGTRLFALRGEVGDKALTDRIVALYASFF
jgi:hypothetical protein